HSIWRDFRDWIKSDDFIWGVLDELDKRHINLGFKRLTPAGRLKRNLKKEQKQQHRNSLAELQIPEGVFEELLVNVLIHRDYLVNAPIRLFLFEDRVEIISPGVLPNNPTIENITHGVSNQRNPIISSFATRQKPPLGLPYRGIGTGRKRALQLHAKIDFYKKWMTVCSGHAADFRRAFPLMALAGRGGDMISSGAWHGHRRRIWVPCVCQTCSAPVV
ncbi:MAG: hypothetical protein ONB49_21140, partial [candidate division KSB1 bacterium]|nr:hypothetical protein [candidate division KSB1 bacterium]